MHLSTVDRFVRKLGPVNALVEKLCERLLPNEVAHASGAGCVSEPCMFDWGCGVEAGTSYATYCDDGIGDITFLHCGC
jgi:hypothetical protein